MRLGYFVSALLCVAGVVFAEEASVTVTGTLVRTMAVGGESTGWTIELEPTITLGGKQIDSIEVTYDPVKRLNELQNKKVKASGAVSYRKGVETGERRILVLSSIEDSPISAAAGGGGALEELVDHEWVLRDIRGEAVIEDVQATLMIAKDGKVSGKGSCNRFFGSATIGAKAIKFGPLGTTRMACQEAILHQETKYLKALTDVRRFEVSDSTLLLYDAGSDKLLRFSRKSTERAADLSRILNRVWQVSSASPNAAPGSLYVFLSNGTLLETSCVETYRVSRWSAGKTAPSQLEVTEDNRAAFTATFGERANGELHMQQSLLRSNETRDLILRAVEQEYVCPDRPK